MDKRNTIELIDHILFSIELIEERVKSINTSDDFLKNSNGLEKLDAISMRLQSIGEAIKNIFKTDKQVLLTNSEKEYWSKIIRLREVISHHYIDIDSEIIFNICNEDLIELKEKLIKIKEKKNANK
ncbi:MAG TPA: DUF86 domain-containing protein [Campylobacterales bacterium]|nr:DUF86 domain-containing protein [Campylobacterales bacterium]